MFKHFLRALALLLPCWLMASPAMAATVSAAATAPATCPSGYSLNGSTCRAQLTCPPQSTPSGGMCKVTTRSTYAASCPAGTQLWSNFCAAYNPKTKGPSTNRSAPACNRGGTLGSGGMCTITTTTTAKQSCPAGGSPVAGMYCQATPYCPATYKLVGAQCKK